MSNSSHLIPDKAQNISVTPSGNLTSTDVQSALQELQTDIDGLGGGSSSPWTNVQVIDLSIAGNPNSIEITNLLANKEYRLIFDRPTIASGSSILLLVYSVDNGSTWLEAGGNNYGYYFNKNSTISLSSNQGIVPEAYLFGTDVTVTTTESFQGVAYLNDINRTDGRPNTRCKAFHFLSRSYNEGTTDYAPSSPLQANAVKLSIGSAVNFGSTGTIILQVKDKNT